jgi:hypothetical protein
MIARTIHCMHHTFGRDFSLPRKFTCYFMAENTIFSTTIGGIGTIKSFWYKVGNPTANTLILEGVRSGTEMGILLNSTGKYYTGCISGIMSWYLPVLRL